MLSFIQNTGRTALTFLSALGRLTLFSIIAIRWIFTPPYYWQQLLRQIIDIGYYSLPVVGLTTLFSGMVLALQSYTGFARFSAEDTVATVVVLSVTRELGPVLAGLMVAGRIELRWRRKLAPCGLPIKLMHSIPCQPAQCNFWWLLACWQARFACLFSANR